MSTTVLKKFYTEPPVCKSEILRYAGCKSPDAEIQKLLDTCIDEALGRLEYKVCYIKTPVSVTNNICDFSFFCATSNKLAKNLNGCNEAVIFGATIGVEIDRLIAKYGHISPVKALIFQALGAERIEALCDVFCADLQTAENVGLKPRFSPGYGDLPLSTQTNIFNLLNCSKNIGLTLNNSLIMSPSKSVTAIVGLTEKSQKSNVNKCALCDLKNCAYRGAL